MAELTPEQARELHLAQELTATTLGTLQQGDLVIVRCDDGVERVGHFAHVDTYPYWTVFPMNLVITLGKHGGVSRRAHESAEAPNG